jgi:PAS domain S-box-containing protein
MIRRRIVPALAVGTVYVAAGKLGLDFASIHASASPVWPPTGIALAAFLFLGREVWPAIFLGAFLVNVTTAGSIPSSVGIAVGNTLEGIVGAALIERYAGGRHVFDRARDIFKFVALAAFASTTVSATIGVTSLTLGGHARWADFGAIWLTWWLGDASGALVFAPPIFMLAGDRELARLRQRPVEAALVLAAVVAVGFVVFGGVLPPGMRNYPVAFVCLPGLLWAAFRFGPREAAALIVVLTCIAVAGTLRGFGPFVVGDANTSLLILQAFMGTTALTVLPVAALVWERQRAQEATRRSEERYRLIADALPQIVFTTTSDGRCDYANQRWHAYTGLTWTDTAEFGWLSALHPDDMKSTRDQWLAAATGGAFETEFRLRRHDGLYRWHLVRAVAIQGGPRDVMKWFGTCTDIEEVKQARAQSEEAERRLAFLGEIARSITASLDLDTVLQRIAQGAQRLCRSDAATLFLRDGDTMTPRYRVGPWLRVFDTLRLAPGQGLGGQAMMTRRPLRTDRYRSDPRVPAQLRAVAEQTGTVALMVVPILTQERVEGLLYLTNQSARAFTDEDETLCVRLAEQAAVAIQNAQLFARQEAARADADAANRAKDEFLAMLGHELRNPLGAISNAVHVLGRLGDSEPRAVHARGVIERQVQHLGRLVDDLLDVSRVMTGKIILQLEPLDLAEIVRRSLTALAGSDRGRHHSISAETTAAWVRVDPTRMEQVVTNLVINALKYTPPGGYVHVSVRADDGRAVLSVRDTGVGITPELLPRVFDLFVQGERALDRTQGGLGIGLTLVRRLVELHGGTVEAASAGRGRGSIFTVRLPLATAPVPWPASAPVSGAGSRRRVLIVEDNDDSRATLRELLGLLGHEVHEASDGATGVARALELMPDVILVDIGLPGLDGYDVARRIRREAGGRHLYLVAVTGYGLPEDRERALAAGYDVHLVKPIDPAKLQAIL